MKKALLCAAALACGCGQRSRGGSYPLPFESELYERVRDADCVSPTGVPLLTRPLSRADCAAVAAEAADGDLSDEFLAETGLPRRAWYAVSSFFLEDPRVRLEWRYGAYEPDNDLGRVYEEGFTTRLPLGGGVMLGDWLVLTGRVEFAFTESRAGEVRPYEYEFPEGSARLFSGKWELMAGREPIWFGPGRHGALLISSNATPLDVIKLSNHEPILLPWGLSLLGPMRFTTFWAGLDRRYDETGAPTPSGRPEFGGMRMEFRPTPRFSFGLSRTVVFGGDDKTVDLDYMWDVFWGLSANEPGGTDDDQKAGFDLRYVARLGRQPVELYMEAAGEDQATWHPSKWATVMGLHLPRLGRLDWARFTVEWATNTWGGDDVWYHHGYHGDYQYDGAWLGHHMGPDAQDLFVSLGLGPRDRWLVEVCYDHEWRNVLGSDPVAHKDEWGLKLRLRSDRAQVSLGYTWQRFTDCLPGTEVSPGAREEGSLFSVGLSCTF